jgi:hypothetical protein
MEDKLKALCNKITLEGQDRLKKCKLDCQANLDMAISHYHIKKKYTYIDIGTSGRYMIVNDSQEIYGIKAYGVIHRGHFYSTLDTIENFYWGNFKAIRIK